MNGPKAAVPFEEVRLFGQMIDDCLREPDPLAALVKRWCAIVRSKKLSELEGQVLLLELVLRFRAAELRGVRKAMRNEVAAVTKPHMN